MKLIYPLLIKVLVLAILIAGCAAPVYKYSSIPVSQRLDSDSFQVKFTPEKQNAEFYSWFQVDVTNLSNASIEIDWNRTAYILDGKNRGRFVWEGIEPDQVKNGTVPNTVIASKQTFSIEISPLAKIAMAHRSDYSAGKDKPGIYGGILPPGENGILVAFMIDGQVVFKKLTIEIKEEKQ